MDGIPGGWWTVGLGVAAMAHSLLLALQTWENRRYVRKLCRLSAPDSPAARPYAAVIVPVKGIDLDLEDSLRSLLRQDYPGYEVHFVGEGPEDPAHEVVRRLMAAHPNRQVVWHSAGRAVDCGQKVHNLLVATGALPPHVELVAFADSDAHPGPDWLANLVHRLLDAPGAVAATGYRCCVPESPRWSNWLLYSLNSGVSALFGAKSPCNLLWGGSWCLRREDLERSGLREAWEKTLSDDMVASRALRSLGRIRYEPKVLLTSATETTLSGLLEFLRRQFFMVRNYSPGLWWLLLASWTVSIVGFWGALALSCWGVATGAPWQLAPIAVVSALYGLSVVRAGWRQQASRASLPAAQPSLLSAQRVERWCAPLISLLGWSAFVASACTRRVVWRGIEYRLARGGKVRLVRRPAEQDAGSASRPGSRAA